MENECHSAFPIPTTFASAIMTLNSVEIPADSSNQISSGEDLMTFPLVHADRIEKREVESGVQFYQVHVERSRWRSNFTKSMYRGRGGGQILPCRSRILEQCWLTAKHYQQSTRIVVYYRR